jgi:hypothetical protein
MLDTAALVSAVYHESTRQQRLVLVVAMVHRVQTAD